jgi:hypothetical protein
MIKSVLTDPGTGSQLAHATSPWGEMLIAAPAEKAYGLFNSATHTTNTTTILATPKADSSILLCDVIMSSEKIAGGVSTIRFYDGATAENIIVAASAEGPINISWACNARIWGWADAYIDYTTSAANQDGSCMISYIHIAKELTLGYDAWNALR